MIKTHVLGFPRIGEQRELKFALEHYWQGKSDAKALLTTAQRIRQKQWLEQQDAGLDFVTVGDFALYDQMANHIQWFGCVPERFNTGSPNQDSHPLQTYFEMARGGRQGQPPLEMTKWFDTNYHYLVPEFDEATRFKLQADSLFDEVKEATRLGLPVKVSLIGPVTFLYLGKEKQTDFDRLSLLESLLPIYSALLKQLHALGVHWVQVDEPILGLDLPGQWAMAFERAYHALHALGPQLLLATYFSELQGHLSLACRLPVAGLHIDAVRGESEIAHLADWLPTHKVLSLGLIDGRNIWRTDLDHALKTIEQLQRKWTGTVWLAPSCSLLHVPYGFGSDQVVNPEVKPWLAGAYEKLLELNTLKIACNQGADGDASIALAQQRLALQSRRNSRLVHRLAVDERINNLPADADRRTQPFAARKAIQANRLQLPPYPTTTIGSFPQTAAIRQVRAAFKRGDITRATYEHAIQADIERAVRTQEALGLDVLVHGEAERNDMVEYFGEQLEGYTFSENGWVQSYGSRCVKPPIIYGDVSRPHAMTVEWTRYAQSLTTKPMKGMLTGPVTMLQWSFVRDDQPRELTALQIALAIRDEVQDLEAAGIALIQIDEPAFREGLPLRQSKWSHYLRWATRAFRISASGVQDCTQIHTHMCYSEFNDILPDIAAMDADVITIETSRSDMELLKGFALFQYPNDIGPGVYDIHSPLVPSVELILERLIKASQVIQADRLWVNPDCGLKTRQWAETEAALRNMVAATRAIRALRPVKDSLAIQEPSAYNRV